MLLESLRAMGMQVEAAPQIGGVIIHNHAVPIGKRAGDVVDVGVAGVFDFPMTPPVGLHIHAAYGTIGVNNVMQSALGPDWQYWSRRFADWNQKRGVHSIVAFVNRVLGDV